MLFTIIKSKRNEFKSVHKLCLKFLVVCAIRDRLISNGRQNVVNNVVISYWMDINRGGDGVWVQLIKSMFGIQFDTIMIEKFASKMV